MDTVARVVSPPLARLSGSRFHAVTVTVRPVHGCVICCSPPARAVARRLCCLLVTRAHLQPGAQAQWLR